MSDEELDYLYDCFDAIHDIAHQKGSLFRDCLRNNPKAAKAAKMLAKELKEYILANYILSSDELTETLNRIK